MSVGRFSWLQPGVYYGVPLVLVLCHHQFRDEELDFRPLTPSQCSSCGRCAGWMSIGCILSFHMFSWCWLLMSTVDWCSEMMWDVLSLGCTVFIARRLHRRLEPVRCPNKVPEQWFLKPVCVGVVQLSCSTCASADRVFHDVTSHFQFQSITRGYGNFSLDPSYPRELVTHDHARLVTCWIDCFDFCCSDWRCAVWALLGF